MPPPISARFPGRRWPGWPRRASAHRRALRWTLLAVTATAASAAFVNGAVSDAQWEQLVAANERLMALVGAQQQQIDELRHRLDTVEASAPQADRSSAVPQAAPIVSVPPSLPAPPSSPIIFSGEVAAAFFSGGADSKWPHDEFRVEEAKLYLEAEILRGTYLFSELDISLRESNDEYVHLGEAYLEFDNLSSAWGQDTAMTLRLGRLDIPFGEEYQYRGPITNPLISRSLADLWGIDEGIEIFGRIGPAEYTLAVQNGGHPALHDWNSDKAVVVRLGFSPTPNWRVSGSLMRTGDLDATRDRFSELWIADGFFRSIGDPNTTTVFAVDLAELNVGYQWPAGHAKLAAGQADYHDDDTASDNDRRLRYVSLEGLQHLSDQWYGAVRYSRILADAGYPLVGNGPFGRFLFGPRTRDISRWGLGVGFKPVPDLVFKVEYTLEDGHLITGESRGDQNQLSAQAAVRF